MEYYPGVKLDFQSVEIKQHVSNMAYDKLLGESIVFLHLCDSNATNTIIECIVRNTPLLINRIEPVTEYLGVDYPLYYSSPGEAEIILQDTARIGAAHEYLKNEVRKTELTGEYFLNSFFDSRIIRKLTANKESKIFE
jgi:hypothetical protein